MALEVRFKVNNLNEAVENAGYLIIDSVRNQIQEGFVNIAEDGEVIIPIESRWVEEGESLRVTIDNYDGSNFDASGAAIDIIKATLVYVDYHIIQDGYFVSCFIETGKATPWYMGDGTILYEENPTHLYLSNGTYTITNDDYSVDVVIEGVVEFSVILDGNIVTCTRQSGTTGKWDFGDGEESTKDVVTHEFYENGTYTVSNSGFSKDIIVSYFSEGLVDYVDGNVVAFTQPSQGESAIFDYGDGSTGIDLLHEYAVHGRFLVRNGSRINYVEVAGAIMPTALFTMVPSLEDSSIVTFSGVGGDSYLSVIEGVEYNEVQVTHDFLESGLYPYEITATQVNGNSNKLVTDVTVYTNNVAPTGEITYSPNQLDVTFSANVVDDDFNASHSYFWVFNAGEEFEDTSYEASPTHSYFPPSEANDPNGQDFTVTCIVTDERGASVSLIKQITVYDFTIYSSNLIDNGNFDEVENYWTEGNQSTSEVTEYEGRSVLNVTSTGGSLSYVKLSINVEIGSSYVLSYTMKALAVLVYSSDSCGVSIRQGGSYTNSTRVENGDFVDVEESFEAIAEVIEVYIYVRRSGSELWLDSINISKEG